MFPVCMKHDADWELLYITPTCLVQAAVCKNIGHFQLIDIHDPY